MRSFLAACLAVIVIALAAAAILNGAFQQSGERCIFHIGGSA